MNEVSKLGEQIMDVSAYTKEDLLLAAIKSEEDSNQLYSTIAKDVNNGLMKDKFTFLAHEEQKHKQFLEDVYKSEFPDKAIILPKQSPVPLPEVIIPDDEDISLSVILEQAIQAEKHAADFYQSISTLFDTKEVQQMLQYFSHMEIGHMKILEQEKESIEWFEQGDVYWPMIHAGP